MVRDGEGRKADNPHMTLYDVEMDLSGGIGDFLATGSAEQTGAEQVGGSLLVLIGVQWLDFSKHEAYLPKLDQAHLCL